MDYYKFKYGDKVNITSYVGAIIPAVVVSRYTSTEHDHPADSHKRYVVLCEYGGEVSFDEILSQRFIDDVAEIELELQ